MSNTQAEEANSPPVFQNDCNDNYEIITIVCDINGVLKSSRY